MRIRKFRPEDAKRVSYLISKTLWEANSKDYSQRVIKNVENKYKPSKIIEYSKNRKIFVAEENGKILGTISLENDTILSAFVNPRYQCRGIGKKLIEHIEKIAKRKGIKKLKVPSITTAVGFYRKMGYKKVKSYPGYVYGKIIMMSKSI